MKSLQPAGSALLAKGEAFFALCLARMQPVPDDCAEKTEYVSNQACHYDERNRSHRIKWLHDVDWLDHVRSENLIKDRLCTANQKKKRPSYMPVTDKHGDH
jgi:hypothetical protein